MVVTIANNGLEVLELLAAEEEHHYDMILMDIQMPIMDGRTATVKIREMNNVYKDIPIIAMTAHAIKIESEKNLASGMNDQVNKPIEIDNLFAALVKYIPPKDFDNQPIFLQDLGITNNETGTSIQIAGLATEEGLKRVLGDEKIYVNLLKSFYKQYSGILDEISGNIEAGRFDANERIVHTIKGNGGNLGAKQLYLSAGKLEENFRNHIVTDSDIADFSSELNIVLNGIQYFLNSYQAPEEEVIGFDPAQLEIEIQMLNHQLQEYNTDAIGTIEKIAKLCSADEKEKWHEIRTLVDDLQFDTALLQLNAISDSIGANLEEKK